MRHLGSIVLSIVFIALSYILAGVGLVKLANGMTDDPTDWSSVGIGVAALIVAGLLYAVLVMARLSPLGPFLAAGLLIAAEVWAMLDMSSLTDLLGTSTFGVLAAQERPLFGLALFAAAPLLITIVSPRRWRGRDSGAVAGASSVGYPNTVPVSAAPIYAPSQTMPETAVEAGAAGREESSETSAESNAAPAAGEEAAEK